MINIPMPAPRYKSADSIRGGISESRNFEKGALIPNNAAASIA